jgi:hypothetical protein
MPKATRPSSWTSRSRGEYIGIGFRGASLTRGAVLEVAHFGGLSRRTTDLVMLFLTRSVSEDQAANDASRFLADASGYDSVESASERSSLASSDRRHRSGYDSVESASERSSLASSDRRHRSLALRVMIPWKAPASGPAWHLRIADTARWRFALEKSLTVSGIGARRFLTTNVDLNGGRSIFLYF